jgi:hypothetical protein
MRIPRFPLTNEDREKYHEKEIKFREIPILKGPKAGSRASGKGKLMISTNGKKGRAEIFVEQWYGDYGTTTIFHLGEVPFRSITASENGFLLDWSRQGLVGFFLAIG